MIQAQIMVDGDIVAVHTSKLTSQNEQVPGSDRASVVHGDTREHATASFVKRLGTGATAVGEHADIVRAAVKKNAEALRKVVDEFEEQEQHSVSWVRDRRELINQTAENTSDEDVRASQQALALEQQEQRQPTSVPQNSGTAGRVSSTGDM
ncbi:hypothetical protein ET475_03420 [Microbacterium protaetiae]|uniref:Uncharacterized protein n=1 Tax=Microbacterium protaetiae TaxID=2509458 RepID=A0A4P6ECQ3_9MICO|nr:hypothetical protein [Microbacterium protaetiae]QAY59133.1 hypothetical protein ET475_03420 [Microbacterium protaetiae]